MKTLQKIFVFFLVATLCLGSVIGVSAEASGEYKVHLGQKVAADSQGDGVWQSASALNEGASSVYYAYENRGDNKFVRMANYDANVFSSYTTVNFGLDYYAKWKSVVNLKFNYRLSEGGDAYREDERILTVSVGGVQKHFTYGDLVCNAQGNYDWNSCSFTLSVTDSDKADRATFIYYYDGEQRTSATSRYLDIDNVEISSGSVTLGSHNIQFAPASSADKVSFSFDYSTQNAAGKSSLMLFGSDAGYYSENTNYSKKQSASFDGADVAAALPRAGSYIYRGATSVKNGESDIYVLYDEASANSFLRLGNFNGSAGATNTSFSQAFYNNRSGLIENMPVTNRIYYTFKYRLYATDEILNGFDLSQNVLQFSTRSASSNNSGFVSFDELIINEPGDGSWHTYHGVMETLTTTTATISIGYFGYENASLTPEIYLDMDDLVLSPKDSDVNYAYLNGSFEGLVPTVAVGEDPFNSSVFNNNTLGEYGEKVKVGVNDYAMKLEKSENLSLDLGWTPVSDVYHVSFKVLGNSGNLKLYFGGRSGKSIDITVGTNAGQVGDALSVCWTKTDDGYDCDLYFARLVNTTIYSLDMVNTGDGAIVIDDLFVGEVKGVNSTAGNYDSFLSQLNSLEAEYKANMNGYKESTNTSLSKAFFNAKKITRYSSEERMQSALKSITALVSKAVKKANLTELMATIERAEKVYVNGSERNYTRSSWLLFEKALLNARMISEESTQSKVNSANAALESAILGLETMSARTNVASGVELALQIGGGSLGVGAIVMGAVFAFKKKKQEETEVKEVDEQ